jgi:surface antigen
MIKSVRHMAVALLIAATLGGCVQAHNGPKQTGGTLIGAGLGALAGAQAGRGRGRLAAVAIGALAGAALGNEVGQSLDRADQMHLSNATARAQAAPIGERIEWTNPDSGNRGVVIPYREGNHRRTGARCREFQNQLTVRGRTREYVGVACQARDGSWTVM